MERRINKRIENYVTNFKDDIRKKAETLGLVNDLNLSQLVQYVYDYERLSLAKEDFMKRKRVKNAVHLSDRCCARRASNEQCTRRKKEGCEYCGTHMKGTPHGIINLTDNDSSKVTTTKIELWAQDIQGIIYYLDKNNNVYSAEDIVSNKLNPQVFAKYTKKGDNYEIVQNSYEC